jgi:outer membrane protein TolC
MRTFVYIGAVSMLLNGVVAARAADEPLTLDDAVQAAMDAAPELLAQRAAIDGAQALVISAGRLPDPELVAGVDNLPSNGVDAWSFGRDFMTMRKIGLMQSFPNSHKRRSEKASALAMVTVAETDAARTRLELTQSVAQAWIARYVAEAAEKNLQQLKPGLALQVELARAALASGRASVSDALSTQAAAADLDDRLLDAQRELATARAELARWIGSAAHRPLAPPPLLAELPAPAAELLFGLHHHAALLGYDAKIAAARSEIAVASAAKRPDWSTELDYAKRGRGFSDMVSLQFQVALPLFSGTRQNPMINAKRAAVRQLEADKETALRMHTSEITTMLSEWQSAKDRIALYEQQRLPLARQRSELALTSLRAGRMELRQTLAVLNDEIEVERSHAELVKTLGKSWAYLHYLPTQGVAP